MLASIARGGEAVSSKHYRLVCLAYLTEKVGWGVVVAKKTAGTRERAGGWNCPESGERIGGAQFWGWATSLAGRWFN
jgi:hypothetical protein